MGGSLAIIPARGGSKGVPGKNIRPVLGKPLIAYTIEAALEARSVGRVLVSTDDPETAAIAKTLGAEVPFMRPAELGSDDTPTLNVVRHVLSELNSLQRYNPEIIVLLQPTSPLRRSEDIDRAIALLNKTKADSVVSVCVAEQNPHWMIHLDGDHRVRPFVDQAQEYLRRQDLPPVYRINGAVYATRTKSIMKSNRLLGEDTRGYIMDEESSIDIDTELDIQIATLLIQDRINDSSS